MKKLSWNDAVQNCAKQKTAQPVEDVGLLKPAVRKKMGVDMAAIFEEVGQIAIEKASTRCTDAIVEETVAFADELAKRVRDTLGKKGIDDAVGWIALWAEAVSSKVLARANEHLVPQIMEGMKAHFPAEPKPDAKQAKVITFADALEIVTDTLAKTKAS